MRKIIHVDMDCFYAAVEVKHRPELRGKAIGVGGPPNSRSVLLTASYEARKFKVRSAMPSSQAARLCPHLIFVPPNFARYKHESQVVREIFFRFTSLVQPLSLDEAYLDVSACTQFGGSATLIAREIRRLIECETELTASAGIAPNKFLAKIASDWKKPNGLFVIRPEEVAKFMPPLAVEKIYGVGRVTAQRMHALGLRSCGDIQQRSLAELSQWFGSRAQELWELARGIDERAVQPNRVRKSLSVEETYGQDLTTLANCLAKVPELYADFSRRLHQSATEERIRGCVVKLKYFDFKSTTHEASLRRVPREEDFNMLLARAWQKRSAPVRLLGIGVRLVDVPDDSLTAQLSFRF